MAQKPTQFCTECGAPLAAGQRFCTNCGATMEINANDPTAAASNSPQAGGVNVATSGPTTPNTSPPTMQASTGSDPYLIREQMDLPPPPPPASGAYNPYTSSVPGGPQIYTQNASVPSAEYAPPPAPTPGTYSTVPPYARARKSHGCLIVSIILLLVLAAGIGGVVFLKTRLTNAINGQANNNTPGTISTTGPGGSSTGNTPGTVVRSSEQLNLKFAYSSIEVSVVSAQLANSFADDHSSTGQAGVVRLNLHEANNSAGNPDYLESDVLLLVLPDGSNVQLTNSQQPISPNSGVSRDNWMDFAMNSQIRLDQLSLRVGTSSQHQMTVPLKPGANLSKYQNKSGSPNAQFQYAGLNWTLKTVALSYSFSDNQATAGNLYVIVTLSIVNNTSNDYYIFPSDYMRMQAGGNSAAPNGTPTLPSNVAASGTGEGAVGFLVPQNATSFTLVMLARSDMNPPATQVTQTFQLQ